MRPDLHAAARLPAEMRAAAQLRAEMRAAARLRTPDTAWPFALRAGTAVAVPLVVLVATGHTAWAGVATFGAFTALYGRDEPYRRRARITAGAAAGLVAAVAVGTLAALAPHPAVPAVVAVALVGAVSTALSNRFRVGPPGGLMFTFATAVCSALPATWADLPRNVLLATATAAVSWLIVMSGRLVAPEAPRRLAIARALRAAAALADTPSGPAGLLARQQAALAVERAWRALAPGPAGSDRRARDHHAEQVLVAHAETELSGLHGHDPRAAAGLRALAARVTRRGPLPQLTATATEDREIAGRRMAATLLRSLPTRAHGPLWPAAARAAVGALTAGAAAGLLAHLTGLGHPYWAAVSAVAVLQAASLRLSLHRALQRGVGTLIGLLIAGAAVAVPGGPWMLVAEIVIAQVVAELLVVRNYGLAMLAVTPLALLVGELGHETPPLDLIGDRLAQTVLGVAFGLAAALVIRNRAATRHLTDAITAVETATTDCHPCGQPEARPPASVQNSSSSSAEPPRVGVPRSGGLGVTTSSESDHGQRGHVGDGPSGVTAIEQGRRLVLAVATMREAFEVASGEPGLRPELADRVLAAEHDARVALIGLSTPERSV
ncbi:FUSC family protein [Actinoplanes sp. LDG1-06]|uniref:FUSC family protein n=1 Tax=Paractinoplanes ovalisporus TaxID=2810368 RepID=A0ABS2ANK8_9ACTN|nr:FUSC family protein [Actinoplanes ovalisporus]MBM2621448.1 FUSC family protein [Actinoplanes ovalisporus]